MPEGLVKNIIGIILEYLEKIIFLYSYFHALGEDREFCMYLLTMI